MDIRQAVSDTVLLQQWAPLLCVFMNLMQNADVQTEVDTYPW